MLEDKIRDYEHTAILYAERYGICEFHITDNEMIYYTSFPMEHMTYRAVVNLDTLEETREAMRGYYKPYSALISGRYQANYMA